VTDRADDRTSGGDGDSRRVVEETFSSWAAPPARLGPDRPMWQVIVAAIALAGVVGAVFGAIGWWHADGGAIGHALTGFAVTGGLVGVAILRVIAWEQHDDDRHRHR
jgi:hypothetical protein